MTWNGNLKKKFGYGSRNLNCTTWRWKKTLKPDKVKCALFRYIAGEKAIKAEKENIMLCFANLKDLLNATKKNKLSLETRKKEKHYFPS